MDKFPQLMALAAEMESMREAMEILEEVWREVGPYAAGNVSQSTIIRMSRFFSFDDSE